MHHYIEKVLGVIIFLIIMEAIKVGWPMLQKVFKKNPTYEQEPQRKIRGYACCFCDEDIKETFNDPVHITTAFNYDKGIADNKRGVLYAFAHWHCLHEHVQPSMKEALTYYYFDPLSYINSLI